MNTIGTQPWLVWRPMLVVVMALLLGSCQKKPEEPQAIYAKYRSGVVLVLNRHYYSVDFDNGRQLFFTLNEKGAAPEIYQTESEAVENASMAFGTGFFISREGQIATNRHVANPVEQGREAAQFISRVVDIYKESLGQKIEELLGEQGKLQQYYNANILMLTEAQTSDLNTSYAALEKQVQELREQLANINYDPGNTEIQVHVVDIGVAYDNTYVTSFDDFKGCVLIKEARDPDVDLAIIQLKDKRTPEHIKNLIPIEVNAKDHAPAINDDVFMIGYNEGLQLALTKEGIKSQFTVGKITQEPDDRRMLYSVPTLPGSSGSPVIDKWGNLVAINFAKVSDTQSFSFGIPKRHLAALLGTSQQSGAGPARVAVPLNESVPNGAASSSSFQNSSSDRLYRQAILGFVAAEDKRDLSRITQYLSHDVRRYWNLEAPTADMLRDRYLETWARVSQSRNIIREVRKVADSTFDLYTEYEYYERSRQRTVSVSSRVRFHFNSAGKIDEVYGVSQ